MQENKKRCLKRKNNASIQCFLAETTSEKSELLELMIFFTKVPQDASQLLDKRKIMRQNKRNIIR